MIFTWCLLSSCILLLIPHSVTGKLQFAFTRILCRPLIIGRTITLAARSPARITIHPKDYQNLEAENRRLKNHLNHLTAVLHEQNKTIETLSGLRVIPAYKNLAFIPADIITAIKKDQLIINRGKLDSVRLNQFILSENAVIGTVGQIISSHQSRIMLFSNQKSRIPVYIQSESNIGILTGKGNGIIKITNVPTKQKIKIGDVVYALKQPGLLDTAFPVGKISQIQPDDLEPLLWNISVTPASDPKRATEAAVIICKTAGTELFNQ